MKQLTLEEIGHLAGVSQATVSRVINDHPNIVAEIRERVLRVIAETGYQPNLPAQSSASHKTKIIGLIIPSVIQDVFSDPYYLRLVQAITQTCNKNKYMLTLFLFRTQEEEKRALERIVSNGLVDGIIVASDNEKEPIVSLLLENNITVIQVGGSTQTRTVTFVDDVKCKQIASKKCIMDSSQLTTANQPTSEIGMVVAETLIDLLQNGISAPTQ